MNKTEYSLDGTVKEKSLKSKFTCSFCTDAQLH